MNVATDSPERTRDMFETYLGSSLTRLSYRNIGNIGDRLFHLYREIKEHLNSCIKKLMVKF